MARVETNERKKVLLTGATGFVGMHLYPRLVKAGYEVICGTRHPIEAEKKDRAQGGSKRFCHFDLAEPASVARALEGVDATVYLVHSMTDSAEYATIEEREARGFVAAAERAKLRRVVYLGGMRPLGKPSKHLQSRLRTGEILRSGTVPTVELQATMIVGGGSESFRMVRDLAARLPFMLLPKWLSSESEPVAIEDVCTAILAALELPLEASAVYTVPGPTRLSGREILARTARLLGHKPILIDVPLVTPKLSSYWIGLVTRANLQVATELVEGLRSDIVSSGPSIWRLLPDHQRVSFDLAVYRALEEEAQSLPQTTLLAERAIHAVAGR